MAQLLSPGSPVAFEVAYGVSALPVAMSVYNVTGGGSVLVSGPAAMTETYDGAYRGYFTPLNGQIYHIVKAVYTDGTFTTLSNSYNPGSETVQAVTVGGGGGTIVPPGPSIALTISANVIDLFVSTKQIVLALDC